MWVGHSRYDKTWSFKNWNFAIENEICDSFDETFTLIQIETILNDKLKYVHS